jgi:DNA-binding XRE family transcriptional regulator
VNRYKALRTQANFTVKEAAKLLHTSTNTLYQIEAGKKQPGIKLQVRMSQIYNISLQELRGETDGKEKA